MSAKDKRKKSVLFLIIGLFWLAFVVTIGISFYFDVKNHAEVRIKERQQSVSFVLESFTPLILSENFEELKNRLEASRSENLIDFYIVQKDGQPIIWHNNFNDLEGINVDYQNFNVLMQNDELAFKTLKILGTKFTVGVFQPKNKLILHTAYIMRNVFLREMLAVTGILGLILYLQLKDIINLSKVLSSRSREDLGKIKATSSEGQALLLATKGLEGERLRLENLSEVYGDTVGPAIKQEIKSGKPAPYNFQATMCRIDLNGYTQMFMEKDNNYLIEILNRYFARARSVIERYDGLIYQFVGDEIVFQFKDETSPELSTESIAAACIRDLFHEAKLIEQGLSSEANHYFKLKGSFAHGLMRFTKLDEGHALSGLPLIESVRLLSMVNEKNHQVLTFFQEAVPQTEDLAFIFDRTVNQLKGFKDVSTICSVRDFNSIDWVFESNNWHKLAYFRKDSDLIFVLKKARLMAVTRQDDDIVRILSALKHHHFTDASPELIKELDLVLSHFVHTEREGLLGTKSLSALVSLVGRIVPTDLAPQTIKNSLAVLLEHKDPRVQANSILVLGQYGYPARRIWEKMYSPSNRVAADTIVEVAKQQLNEDLMKALDRLLVSKDENHRKSGAYAVDNILKYYKESNPVFFAASPFIARIRDKERPSKTDV